MRTGVFQLLEEQGQIARKTKKEKSTFISKLAIASHNVYPFFYLFCNSAMD